MTRRFGERVADERKRLGITAVGVAERAGISPQYLNDIEHGRRGCPPMGIVKAIADALDCDVSFLDPVVRVPLSWVCKSWEEIERQLP